MMGSNNLVIGEVGLLGLICQRITGKCVGVATSPLAAQLGERKQISNPCCLAVFPLWKRLLEIILRQDQEWMP